MSVRHILLIDDDEDDHEIFLAALAKTSATVKCTVSPGGREALEMLTSGKLQPDLIILDLNMPVMNGQEFLTEIKKEKLVKHIPVIILSTSSHKPTIELTKELGASNFIIKPDKFEDLVAQLRVIVNEE